MVQPPNGAKGGGGVVEGALCTSIRLGDATTIVKSEHPSTVPGIPEHPPLAVTTAVTAVLPEPTINSSSSVVVAKAVTTLTARRKTKRLILIFYSSSHPALGLPPSASQSPKRVAFRKENSYAGF